MILLDTHALLWMVVDPPRLSSPARAAIGHAHANGGLAIASITLWEMAMMFALGRIRTSATIEAAVTSITIEAGVVVKNITPIIAALSVQFPASYPADPADRLIGATARAEGLVLVTRDRDIRASGLVKTLW